MPNQHCTLSDGRRARVRRFNPITVTLLCLFWAPAAWATDPLHPTGRRWVLTVSQNEGEGNEERLRYADSDALRIQEAMQDVGFAQPKDVMTSPRATAQTLRAALAELTARLQAEATGQDQLFIYVSSHADEDELHLAGTRFPVHELKAFVQTAPVGTVLLMVDSCRAGALTRIKGLKAQEGISLQAETEGIRGRVIISSSGANEAAHESEALEGSIFTHHWAAGLRGAADSSQDGNVTLQEAYAYAYARTLDSTFAARGGFQHPSFHVDLRGQGEWVLSQPQRNRARLRIEVERPGSWQLRNTRSDAVVLQFEKKSGPLELALKPDRYRVRMRLDNGMLERTVTLAEDAPVVIRSQDLTWMPLPRVARKGASAVWSASVGATLSNSVVADVPALWGVEAHVHWVQAQTWALGDTLTLAALYRTGTGTRWVPFVQHEGELRGGWARTWDIGRLTFSAGPELGVVVIHQSRLPQGTTRTNLSALAGIAMDLRIRVQRGWGLFVSAQGAGVLTKKEPGLTLSGRGAGVLGLTLEL